MKPRFINVLPFDADYDATVSIRWTGSQSYRNKVIIYDNETQEEVYNRIQDTMSLSHTIPGRTLINGNVYQIRCAVYDATGNESQLSDKINFLTLGTPMLLCDIAEDTPIASSSCNMNVSYYQPQGEPLSQYRFALYDSYREPILESEPSSGTEQISYSFKGLESGARYFIRCYGVTANGMKADTGYISIRVNYGETGKYARIYAANEASTGGVRYHTNIRIILPDEEDYEFEDGKLNLVGKTITYSKGFLIEGDFTLKLSGTHLYRNGDILIPENDNGSFRITAFIYDDCHIRYKLIVPNGISHYLLYSNPLYCTNEDLVTLVLRRVNNIYDIKAFL